MERLELGSLLDASVPDGRAAPNPPLDGAATIVDQWDPSEFMSTLAAAARGTGPVFLADPWRADADRSAIRSLAAHNAPDSVPPPGERGWLMIPSGGTGGGLKLVRHDQDTILAAVTGFSRFFGAGPVRCVGILPLHHVSGLMAWMRAAITGGTYLPWDWKRLEAGDRPVIPEGRWFISVVPTQLRRLMASGPAIDWLRGFHAVFVGGGPLWPDLADAAADAGLPISLSYGATETAAMAAALPPGEFLAGGRSCGVALPHAGIDLSPEGVVRVAGESIFRGYFPAWLPGEPGRPAETRPAGREFITGDLGAIDSGGRLQILGRVDHVIITGGKKADPLEIEAALLSTGEFSDVVVLGVPDPEWGESVVAFYPSSQKPPDQARIAAGLSAMPAHKRPRRYTAVPEWIRNAQGKVNRRALLEHIRRDPG